MGRLMSKQPVNILLVEDEAAHATLITRAFEDDSSAWSLQHASTLKEATSILAKHQPDLMLLDNLLPDGEGSELLPGDIEKRALPIVMMTAYGDEKMAVNALKSGALDYIVKSDAVFADMPHVVERAMREWQHIMLHRETQAALLRSEKSLKNSLTGTIKAITKAIEARDPYTAGHQQRVSNIACGIAQEMGLDKELIEGIRMGAVIHDIGKIQTPAELLSKPSKLTAIEYQLIQEHASVGYEILKDIEFPWPVAEIAHQHHERINGSGYPQGLKGENICLEARIVAVADVVEAISSHRPYRPALGIDVAMEEITAHRGEWYDPVAVDACLSLFRKNKFSFEK